MHNKEFLHKPASHTEVSTGCSRVEVLPTGLTEIHEKAVFALLRLRKQLAHRNILPKIGHANRVQYLLGSDDHRPGRYEPHSCTQGKELDQGLGVVRLVRISIA